MKNMFLPNFCSVVVLGLIGAIPAAAAGVPFIDTQAQFDPAQPSRNYTEIADAIVAEMDKWGVSMTFLVPPPQAPYGRARQEIEDYLPVLKKYPGRFAALGGGGTINRLIIRTNPGQVSDADRRELRARAEEILATGALGLGEVTSSHYSLPKMMQGHPYEATAPDHPLLLQLADIAAEKNVPIDVHFDVVPQDMPIPPHLAGAQNPSELKANLPQFEKFLAHNRGARIVWSHAGSDPGRQRSPALMQRLLAEHPNLYMSIRLVQMAPLPFTPLAPDGKLKEIWLKLFMAFPDRFIMQTDAFYGLGPPLIQFGSTQGLELARRLLDQLPEDVAEKFAYGNVERIYNLRLKR
ncbi:MAG: amidohydrolase family protein [Burkholderiales bacterium]